MKNGEGNSSGDEQRKVDLLREIRITEEQSQKFAKYSFDEVLSLNEEDLIFFFGIEDGILYTMNLEKIRKRLNPS